MTEATPWIGPEGQRMRRLELHVTYHCPERCVFCSEDGRMREFNKFPVTFERVATVLRREASRGVEAVHFTGGEPTIHPRFIDILRLAKKLGMRTSIGTIGTRLADPEWAAAALPHLDEALFSLHGPDASVHDALAGRRGSFVQVNTAMENASRLTADRSGRPFGLFVNTVLTPLNLEHLVQITQLARTSGASLQILSNLTPEGAGEVRYDALAVPLSRLGEQVPRLVEAAGAMVLRFFGVPMCILGPYAMFSNDLHWNPRVTVEWAALPGKVSFEGVYSWTPARRREQAAPCAACKWRGVCAGVFSTYLSRFGANELQPEAS